MANRKKNEKHPYGPDPRMLRQDPAPEAPKHWTYKPSQYCKKLKGPHCFDIDETEKHDGVHYYSIVRCEGRNWRMYSFWGEGEPLGPGEYLDSVRVSLYYRCIGCGKKEILSYKIDL